MNGFDELGELPDAVSWGSVYVYREWLVAKVWRHSGDPVWRRRSPLEWRAHPPEGEARVALSGLSVPVAWEPGWNTARCHRMRFVTALHKDDEGKDEKVPNRDCGCGYWGYWLPENVDRTPATVGPTAYFEGVPVFGVAKIAGRGIRGRLGIRVEKARIVGLCCPNSGVAEVVAAAYPDVRIFKRKEDLVAAFPPTDVKPLIGMSAEEARRREIQGQTALQQATGQVGRAVTQTMQAFGWQARQAMKHLMQTYGIPDDDEEDETPQQRALNARRNRNTGPKQAPPWLPSYKYQRYAQGGWIPPGTQPWRYKYMRPKDPKKGNGS